MNVRETFESGIELKKEFDVLKFRAKVISPGTWSGRSGVPYTYTEESIQSIFENIDGATEVEIWHDGVPCGIATRFYIDKGELYAEGIIYDHIDAILEAGIDRVSPELTLYVNDEGTVVSGKLEKIAFVKNPGIKSARILEVAKAAFEDGGDVMWDKLLDFLKDKLSADDFAAVEALINEIKEKYPYPYPKPTAHEEEKRIDTSELEKQIEEYNAKITELQQKIEEYEKALEESKQKIEEYEAKLAEYQKKEEEILEEQYNAIATELSQKGFDVERLVTGVEDIRAKLDIVKRIKDSYVEAHSNVQIKNEPDTEKITAAAKELGLSESQLIELLGGGK